MRDRERVSLPWSYWNKRIGECSGSTRFQFNRERVLKTGKTSATRKSCFGLLYASPAPSIDLCNLSANHLPNLMRESSKMLLIVNRLTVCWIWFWIYVPADSPLSARAISLLSPYSGISHLIVKIERPPSFWLEWKYAFGALCSRRSTFALQTCCRSSLVCRARCRKG